MFHRETIALSERIDGPLDPNTVIRVANFGWWFILKGQYDQGRAQFAEALRRAPQVWPPDNDIIAYFESGQGSALSLMGRLDEALAAYQRAETITRTGIGKSSPRYITRIRRLAGVYLQRHELERADAVLTEGRALVPQLGAENSRGGILVGVLSGRLALARGNAQHALDQFTLSAPELELLTQRDRIALDRDRGRALSVLGRFDQAETLLADALARIESETSPGNVESARCVQAVIEHHVRRGNPMRGIAAGQALLRTWQAAEQPNWQVALAMGTYATALAAQDPPRARAMLERVEAVLTPVIGGNDPRLGKLREALR